MKLTSEDLEKLHTKQLANVIRKIGSGKTPTAREAALLAQSTVGGEPSAPSGFVATWDELAQRLNVSRKSLQNWRSRPDLKDKLPRPRADGRHDVVQWARAMVHQRLARADELVAGDEEEPDEDRPRTVTDWKKEKEKRQVRKLDIEIGQMEGKLLLCSDLEVFLGATFAAIQTKLSQFPARTARFMMGLRDEAAAEEKLHYEMDAVLSDLHAVRYLDESVNEVVASLPFDVETERLFALVAFEGQDRAALLELITHVTRAALCQVGRRVLQDASGEARSAPGEPEPVPAAAPQTRPPSGAGESRATPQEPESRKSTAARKRGRKKPAGKRAKLP